MCRHVRRPVVGQGDLPGVLGGEGKRVKTLSLQEPGRGQIQCTSWRNLAPFTTSTFIDIHASAQAWGTAGDRQWVRDT